MKRINLTLTDEEFLQLLKSYSAFLKRYDDDPQQTGMPPSITGYAAGTLIWAIKESLKGEKD